VGGRIDFIIANACLPGRDGPCAIAARGNRIEAIGLDDAGGAPRVDAEGALAIRGFVEPHIHLDKAGILDRCPICEGTLAEAVRLTARAKAAFTAEDVYSRAEKVLVAAILNGTTAMRSFVETDPAVGLRSFEALSRLRSDYAFAIDLQLWAFAQEGLTGVPETGRLLREALANGADGVGGCPYTDSDPVAHVAAIFDIAEAYDVPVDFHVDFDLSPENAALPTIVAETERRGFRGRVSVGHATKLSALPREELKRLAGDLARAGVSVTALPATDLFLTGRQSDHLVPRGVVPLQILAAEGVLVSVGCNNILNPFTPFGDPSLIRMANLFANIAHLASDSEMELAFDMITSNSALQLGLASHLEVGGCADIALLDAPDPAMAVRALAPALRGWKAGRETFRGARSKLIRQ